MIKLAPDIGAEIKRKVGLITPKIIEIRRDLHQHPERSKREKRPSDLVTVYLTDLGYEVIRGTNTYSVTAVPSGQKKGKTIVLRAYMDALKL
tara:strand:+ start:143 stop:418 length:276 start_codon:yes stop_codon:yes gene_type:complete